MEGWIWATIAAPATPLRWAESPESYGTSRLGDEARAGDGPRGSDLSGWPMVMV